MAKIGKFQKKKIEDVTYLISKVNGKLTGKQTKALKHALNEAVENTLHPIDLEA